jgi:hypothetical protein
MKTSETKLCFNRQVTGTSRTEEIILKTTNRRNYNHIVAVYPSSHETQIESGNPKDVYRPQLSSNN